MMSCSFEQLPQLHRKFLGEKGLYVVGHMPCIVSYVPSDGELSLKLIPGTESSLHGYIAVVGIP